MRGWIVGGLLMGFGSSYTVLLVCYVLMSRNGSKEVKSLYMHREHCPGQGAVRMSGETSCPLGTSVNRWPDEAESGSRGSESDLAIGSSFDCAFYRVVLT
jgi:hypothetical protein